jgi:hypothetical protein
MSDGQQLSFISPVDREIRKLTALRQHVGLDGPAYAELLARLTGKTPVDTLDRAEAGVVINHLLAEIRSPRRRREVA